MFPVNVVFLYTKKSFMKNPELTRTLFIFVLFAASTTTAISAEQSYIREYTYKASDLDSRVTARSNALKLIKASELE